MGKNIEAMKKILFSILLVTSVISVLAQTLPCVEDYRINNGGGNCPDIGGVGATGSITLSFDGTVDASNIPIIVMVEDITDPLNPILVTGITFGPGNLLANGDVTYCYYIGPNNNNNLLGANAQFRFFISYNEGALCGEQGTLPVSIKFFTTARISANVSLVWETVTEVNNKGYFIQRKIGAGAWVTIGFIPSKADAGNSFTTLRYEFTDNNPTKGITQYRLLQVDIDGKFAFSNIRAVRGIAQKSSIIIYPNPSNDGKVNVVFEDASVVRNVTLMDMSGRILKQWRGITNNNVQIDNLAPGVYNVRIENTETSELAVEKIVVNKR